MDLLYTHTFNPVLNYAAEALYGWQYDCPPGAGPARGNGTANWASLSQYMFYTMSSRVTATLACGSLRRLPRASAPGSTGCTPRSRGGLAYQVPRRGLIIRPELRWDTNNESRAFNAPYNPSHNLFTAAMDVIVRW